VRPPPRRGRGRGLTSSGARFGAMLRGMPDDEHQVHGSERKYKEGHPRFNVVILILLVVAFLVFALIEAQRLQL